MSTSITKTWEALAAKASVEPLAAQFRPRLLPEVSFLTEHGKVTGVRVIEESTDFDSALMAVEPVIGLEGARREQASRLAPWLTGDHTVTEIAAKCDWNRDDCSRAVQELYELAVLTDAAARPAPALSFYRHALALGRRGTVRQLSRSPVVQLLARGQLSKRLVVGYLVEEYHLVASAASHIAPVIAAAPNERLRRMFSDYLSGEYWHCLLLEKGLLAAGLSQEQIAASDPLPGTLAAINLCRDSARTDLLAYAVCLSISEGGDAAAAQSFGKMYDALAHVVAPEVLAPSREHAELDAQDEHDTLGAEPFADELLITAARQNAIRRCVFASIRTQLEQHRQIAEYYGASEGPLAHSYL
jgi:pyrroloquinoline quinone (PQQ) biosynthesis protein C